ncbi:MAG: DUF2868 domain-containing protein [Gammaproteobacteria bacterium]
MHWLESDSATEWQEKLTRDRKTQYTPNKEGRRSPLDQVMQWWEAVQPGTDGPSAGERVDNLFFWSSVLTVLIGVIVGASVAGAVLYYDGSSPINVFWAFLLLVGLPLLTLVLSLFLPWSRRGGALSTLNTTQVVQSMLSTFSRWRENDILRVLEAFDAHLRWRLAANSQLFGLAFSCAALVVLITKVTLSDLAFAWGSSLDVNSEIVSRATVVLSAPWSSLVPQAVPDLELIETSRYFRLSDIRNEGLARSLTRWWPFLAMSVFVYGVMIRAGMFALAAFQAKRCLRNEFLAHPQVVALVARLNMPAIVSDSNETEARQTSPELATTRQFAGIERPSLLVIWQQAAVPDEFANVSCLTLNGVIDLDEIKAKIMAAIDGAGPVVISTKSWEPPLLEFHDALRALREMCGAATPVIVLPVDPHGKTASEAEKAVWQQSLATINDPHLFVQ